MSRLIPFLACFVFFACVRSASAATTTRDIFFPTDPSVSLDDNFGELRAGHLHEGIDMMGEKMMPLYSAVNGRVRGLEIPEASWGYAITLEDADGYTYHYIHVNDDTPGTDDGAGGTANAYAPGISKGVSVTKGQLIGWMGDSGNAEEAGAHLHFEIRESDDTAINPYPSLVAARFPGTYDKDEAAAESPDINADKGLVPTGEPAPCVSGTLIKSASTTAVYYCGANGKRYTFPNDKIFFSWYTDFKSVKTVTNDQLAAVQLGGNVTYRPGIRMVKIESLPNVYAIVRGGLLRWIISPTVAASIYGVNWAKNVHDVSDAFFGDYKIGESITATR